MDLEEKLKTCLGKENHSFHFPGHKGKCQALYQDFYSLDTTETFGTDNLARPRTALKDAMEKIAKIYGAKASYMGVGGSSMGIYAGLYSLTKPGQTLGLPRNAHRSFFQAAELLQLNISLIDLEVSKEGLGTWISPKTLSLAKPFDLLVVASPSYYGALSPLQDLISYAHRRRRPVLVDEAHGGHLPFFSKEDSGIYQGAEITVHSVHKMLPGLTSTALVHAQEGVDLNKLRQGLNLFTTSSPSYLLMTSIQKAVDWMDQEGRTKIRDLLGTMPSLYDRLTRAGIALVHGGRQDPFKWLIQVPGYSGKDLYETLFYKYGLALEMYDQDWALAVLSPVDELGDLNLLVQALEDLPKRDAQVKPKFSLPKLTDFIKLRDRRTFKTRKVYYKEALGCLAGDFVTPYPPGIPILYPQSRIRDQDLAYIDRLIQAGMNLEGLDEDLRMDVIL